MNGTEATENHQVGHWRGDQDYNDVRMLGPAVDIFKMYVMYKTWLKMQHAFSESSQECNTWQVVLSWAYRQEHSH